MPSTVPSLTASVPLALLAALLLGTGAVLQHQAASRVPVGAGRLGSVRFLRALAARPLWVAGQGVGLAGLALFGTALHLGQVAVVQPLLASQVVFSLVVTALVQRRRTGAWGVRRAHWASAAVVLGGVVLFLASARPAAGSEVADGPALAAAVAGVLVLDAVVLALVRRASARSRALLLALAAGCGFGVDALLLKAASDLASAGQWLSWPPLALAVVASTSVVLAQRAFQAGSVAGVLPAITVLEPVVAITLAGPVFGEALASGPLWRLGQLAAVAALAAGVLVLSRDGAGSLTGDAVPDAERAGARVR